MLYAIVLLLASGKPLPVEDYMPLDACMAYGERFLETTDNFAGTAFSDIAVVGFTCVQRDFLEQEAR